ncbi:MAG: NBR1-Ig-like domain-containing protein [Thiothrix sp.]
MSALEVADYLRVRLKAMDMTTTEAARRSGISRQTWHKLLRADISEARLSTLIQVADTLEVPPLSMLRIFFEDAAGKGAKGTRTKRYPCALLAETYPDYSAVAAGQSFEKTWDVINLSGETWSGWQLKCIDAAMRAKHKSAARRRDVQYNLHPQADSIALPETSAGETLHLSMTFQAPNTTCTAVSHWQLLNAQGQVMTPKLTGLYCIVKVTA